MIYSKYLSIAIVIYCYKIHNFAYFLKNEQNFLSLQVHVNMYNLFTYNKETYPIR